MNQNLPRRKIPARWGSRDVYSFSQMGTHLPAINPSFSRAADGLTDFASFLCERIHRLRRSCDAETMCRRIAALILFLAELNLSRMKPSRSEDWRERANLIRLSGLHQFGAKID